MAKTEDKKRCFILYFPGTFLTVWNATDLKHARNAAEECMRDKVVRVKELFEGDQTPQGAVLDLNP